MNFSCFFMQFHKVLSQLQGSLWLHCDKLQGVGGCPERQSFTFMMPGLRWKVLMKIAVGSKGPDKEPGSFVTNIWETRSLELMDDFSGVCSKNTYTGANLSKLNCGKFVILAIWKCSKGLVIIIYIKAHPAKVSFLFSTSWVGKGEESLHWNCKALINKKGMCITAIIIDTFFLP